MPHVVYDVNKAISLIDQYGAGNFEGARYMRGTRFLQRGTGVLGVLGKAWKYILPLLKSTVAPAAKAALRAVAEEGAERGMSAIGNIMSGEDPKAAIKVEGTKMMKNLVRRGASKLTGDKYQKGSGRRKKAGRRSQSHSALSIANLERVGRSVLDNPLHKKRPGLGF